MDVQNKVLERLVGVVAELVKEVAEIKGWAAGENHVQYLRGEVQSLRDQVKVENRVVKQVLDLASQGQIQLVTRPATSAEIRDGSAVPVKIVR